MIRGVVKKDARLRSVITSEALDWFVRNRSDELTEEDRQAFSLWLRTSPLHIEAYLKTAVASESLHIAANAFATEDIDGLLRQAASQDDPQVVLPWRPERDSADRAATAPRAPWMRMLGAATVILMVLFSIVWLERDGQRFGLPKEYVTGHGEQRSWLLPDGSGLDLHSDSAVVLRFTRSERMVNVERGQALFQVVHERARRFQVSAGRTTVIAVGTEFDVDRQSARTLVTVVQGRVAVLVDKPPPPTRLPVALPPVSERELFVDGGQQVRIDNRRAGAGPSLVSRANVEQAVAWVKHQIAFDREPLSQVASEFNHYSNNPILIQSDRLRHLSVSGVLNQFDTESFLAFISRLDDVKIVRLPGRIVVMDATDPAAIRQP